MTTKLKSLRLENFKSIRNQSLDLDSLNVLIGANGAGKSNLLSFFKLLNEMIGGRLQEHIQVSGGANSLLHYGSKHSPHFEAELTFTDDDGQSNEYFMRMLFAPVDRLIFGEERLTFHHHGTREQILGAGYDETKLNEVAKRDPNAAKDPHDKKDIIQARVVKRLLNNCRVYQFHDTSITSGIRNPRYVDDNRYLRPDASNLAAFLHRLQRDYADSYSRIRKTVQQVLPFFDDFDLDPIAVGGDKVRLNWQERDSDHLFGPHQLSDGSLRAMALIALLLQPFESLPTLLVLDEPELGLHPAAINIVSALMKQAALHCQLLIATQSTALLDEFDPTQVTVVERDEVTKSTTFERLDPNKYTDWLDKYTLHELWERNVIGGGPF